MFKNNSKKSNLKKTNIIRRVYNIKRLQKLKGKKLQFIQKFLKDDLNYLIYFFHFLNNK